MAKVKPQPEGFVERLRAAMLARGYASDTSRSGVDVNALAAAASITYEMARRYAEGLATPRPDKIEAIAAWLGVSPGALMWGQETHQINTKVLQQCVMAVHEAQRRTRITLTTEKAAHLVAILYEETSKGKSPTADTVDLMLRAV